MINDHLWNSSCGYDGFFISVIIKYKVVITPASVTSSDNEVVNVLSVLFLLFLHVLFKEKTLRWRHNDHAGVSNHQPHGCLLNRLFRRKSKKTSKLCVTGLCAGNSPGTGEFPAQMASNAENVSIGWRHHDFHRYFKLQKYLHRFPYKTNSEIGHLTWHP